LDRTVNSKVDDYKLTGPSATVVSRNSNEYEGFRSNFGLGQYDVTTVQ